ncbi:MAG: hypothetical protein ABI921_09370, partial [Panacibacter sp.]
KSVVLLFIIAGLVYSPSIHAAVNANSPILILGEAGHFDGYTAEILKTEGFNEFQIESLTGHDLSLSHLQKFDIIILTPVAITNEQKEVLSVYVKDGGNLIAFKPDEKLASVFGIKNKSDSLSESYISIDSLSEICKGLIPGTLQIHSAADLYLLDGCKIIASLYKNAVESTIFPAAVLNNYGLGHAIAFTYDLPKSIAYTRQGNYHFAGQEKDSIKGLRAMDLFTDGWVDTSKNTINQADEQMRLLSHCIEHLCSYKKPLPRFWYFPDTLKCLVTLTNDGEYRAEKDFEPQLRDVEAKGANMALYILSTDKVSKTATDLWQQRGNEISGHPDDTKEAEHPTWVGMNNAIITKLAEIKNKFDIPAMHTIVNHWFVWCGNNADSTPDFTAQAKIEASHGIGMDINYAHYDNNSNQPRFLGATGMAQGNYTGSGLPMKLATADGAVVNIYQHLNNVYDQQYMEHKDSTGFYNCFKGLMDRSLKNEVYSYISIKAHNDEYFFSKTPLLNMLDYAKQHNIPVWTPVKLLDFLKAKDEAVFTNIKWSDNNRLSFKIKSALNHSNNFTCMVPYRFNTKKIIEITVNGLKQSYLINQVKGFDYAFLTIKPGADYSIEVTYSK